MKKGYSYDIAKYIKIDIEPYALEYLQSNLLKNPYIIYDISKKENMEKLVSLVEKRLPLEKMKGSPTDKINFKYEEFTVLDVAVRSLENFEGTGKNLIICALNSPYVNVRYGGTNTLQKWKDTGYIFPNEIIENIKNLEKIEVDTDLKERVYRFIDSYTKDWISTITFDTGETYELEEALKKFREIMGLSKEEK